VLRDCINAGKRVGAIYKEPTITPTEEQAKLFGLKKAWGSPNGLHFCIFRYNACRS
jgi:isocitrate dehydrogenase